MATTTEIISNWFDRGVQSGATHMIVVCDTYDYEDYPVFILPGEDARKKSVELGEMQQLIEVYNLAMAKDPQIRASRTFNY